jgi:hypothetical protein
MREILIGFPSGAFAFGINASQFGAEAPGPSQAAHPPAEHKGSGGTAAVTTAASPLGCEEVFARSRSSSEWCLSLAWSTMSKVRSCFYPWERFTTERPNTIQLARCYGRILATE